MGSREEPAAAPPALLLCFDHPRRPSYGCVRCDAVSDELLAMLGRTRNERGSAARVRAAGWLLCYAADNLAGSPSLTALGIENARRTLYDAALIYAREVAP